MRRTRWMQTGLLFLLAVCVAQVLYWLYDHALFTKVVRDRSSAWLEADVRAAQTLAEKQVPSAEILTLFPHLSLEGDGAEQHYRLNDAAREMLDNERYRRLNRYGWEGTFFLVVLLGGMGVLWHALRRDHELRLRQENFLAAVSHELKSPTASLRLSLETLEQRDPEPERRNVIVARMLEDLDRLETLLLNMLDAARLGQGRIDPLPETLDLGELVEEVCEPLARRTDSSQVKLVHELQRPLWISMDAVAARTVVQNLLDNALKSCSAAGGGRVSVRARTNGKQVELMVEDTGLGFEPSEARKLFGKFYRVGDELRRRQRGAGLGLFLVQRLVRLAGGRVEACSEGPGRGAHFCVRLPRATEAP